MNIEELYVQASNDIVSIASKQRAKKRYVALGLASNLDLICHVDTTVLHTHLHTYFASVDLENIRPPLIITTAKEFLQTILFYCSRGIGGEVPIRDIGIIQSIFSTTPALGGTGIQGAATLAAVGYPSIIHLTDDSKEVCTLLDSPHIFAVNNDGKLVQTAEIEQQKEQEIHCVVQFTKGDVITLPQQSFTIPESNRIIMTKITVNHIVPLHLPYFTYIEEHAHQITSQVLSSVNEITDTTLLLQRVEFLISHIKRYKANNARAILFFEDAHYHDKNVRELTLPTLYPYIDIVSMNEEELAYTLQGVDFSGNLEDIFSCVEGMHALQEKYAIQKGVIVHTKEYSIYVGKPLEYDIAKGLLFGNLLATTKALFGLYGTLAHTKVAASLPLSSLGVELKQRVDSHSWPFEVVLIPTNYIKLPRYTIGLGDAFASGVQICFTGDTND